MNLKEENVISAIGSCYILHNICEDHGHNLPNGEPVGVPCVVGDCELPGRCIDRRNVADGEKVKAVLMAWMRRHGRR